MSDESCKRTSILIRRLPSLGNQPELASCIFFRVGGLPGKPVLVMVHEAERNDESYLGHIWIRERSACIIIHLLIATLWLLHRLRRVYMLFNAKTSTQSDTGDRQGIWEAAPVYLPPIITSAAMNPPFRVEEVGQNIAEACRLSLLRPPPKPHPTCPVTSDLCMTRN